MPAARTLLRRVAGVSGWGRGGARAVRCWCVAGALVEALDGLPAAVADTPDARRIERWNVGGRP